MLLGARQGCVAGESLAQKMEILRGFNYDFLELALSKEEIRSLTDDEEASYRQLIEDTGLPILSTSMGHFPGFAAQPAEERRAILDDLRKFIAFTRAIGGDTVLVAIAEQSTEIHEYISVYRDELTAVADEAQAAGVTLAFEHVGRFKPYTLAKLVKALGHPALGVYFDMGNCLYVGENPIEQARICAPVTAQLHIKGGPTAPLAAMPLVEVREILEDAGFQGRGCLEIPPMERNPHLPEARALLKMAGY